MYIPLTVIMMIPVPEKADDIQPHAKRGRQDPLRFGQAAKENGAHPGCQIKLVTGAVAA